MDYIPFALKNWLEVRLDFNKALDRVHSLKINNEAKQEKTAIIDSNRNTEVLIRAKEYIKKKH